MAVTKTAAAKSSKAKPSGAGKTASLNRTAPEGAVSTLARDDRVKVKRGPFGNAVGTVESVSGAVCQVRIARHCLITEDDSNLEVVL